MATNRDITHVSHAQLDQWLGNQHSKRVGSNKVVYREGNGDIHLMLHTTPVVTFHPNGDISVRRGGYPTRTTAAAIGKAGGLPVSRVGGEFEVARRVLGPSDKPRIPADEIAMWRQSHDPVAAAALEDMLKERGVIRLARPTSVGAAYADATSTQHDKRLDIARAILKEAGISPAAVRAVIANGTRAGVVQMLAGRVHPELAKYVAAWFGLLSGERTQTVFHPADGGRDSLHVISTAHPPDQVSATLRDAGAQAFSVEPKATGSRVYLFNSNNEFDVQPVLRTLGDAKHVSIPGVGTRVGSPESDSAARDAYRNTIRDFENGSNPAAE